MIKCADSQKFIQRPQLANQMKSPSLPRAIAVFVGFASAVCLLNGCDRTVENVGQSSDSAGAIELISVTPVHYDGTGSPYSRELLKLTDFTVPSSNATQAKEYKIHPWRVRPVSAMESAIQLTETEDGEEHAGITISGPANQNIFVEQDSEPLPSLTPDSWVVARMRMWAEESDRAGLLLTVSTLRGIETIGQPHPGGGIWKDLTIAIPVHDATPRAAITLTGFVRGKTASNVQITEANLAVYPDATVGRKVTAISNNYVVNGGFDDFGLQRAVPYPWAESHWGSKDGSVSVAPHDQARSGRYAALLTPPSKDGAAAISQVLQGLHKKAAGKRILSSVDAFCDRPDQLTFAFRSFANGALVQAHSATIRHPGDGQWHKLELEVELPVEHSVDQLEVMVFHKPSSNGPGGNAIADDISVIVVDAATNEM